MSNIPPVNQTAPANRFTDEAPGPARAWSPTPLGDEVFKRLTVAFTEPQGAGKPGAAHERDVSLSSIGKGEDGAIDVGLRSGGGMAKVTLEDGKATFYMSTPAFLHDKPGITTQNVVEYEIDLANPENAREAGLIDDLANALESADDSGMIPPEAALLERARELVDQPDVLVPRTSNVLQAIVRELLEKLLGNASVPEIKDCLERIRSIPVGQATEAGRRIDLGAFGAISPRTDS